MKNGEGLGTPITCMMPGGREVDVGVGGVVPNYEFVCNKPLSEFLTSEVEYC